MIEKYTHLKRYDFVRWHGSKCPNYHLHYALDLKAKIASSILTVESFFFSSEWVRSKFLTSCMCLKMSVHSFVLFFWTFEFFCYFDEKLIIIQNKNVSVWYSFFFLVILKDKINCVRSWTYIYIVYRSLVLMVVFRDWDYM